jgi:hypothetical protein
LPLKLSRQTIAIQILEKLLSRSKPHFTRKMLKDIIALEWYPLVQYAIKHFSEKVKKQFYDLFKHPKKSVLVMEKTRGRIATHLKRDNINTVRRLLTKLMLQFKSFVHSMKFALVILQANAHSNTHSDLHFARFYSLLGKIREACVRLFFATHHGIFSMFDNYEEKLTNVDLEILSFFHSYKENDAMYITSCLKNIQTIMQKTICKFKPSTRKKAIV